MKLKEILKRVENYGYETCHRRLRNNYEYKLKKPKHRKDTIGMTYIPQATSQIRKELIDRFQRMHSFDPDTKEGAGYYACNTQAIDIIKSFCEEE